MSTEMLLSLLAELPALVFVLWLSHRMTTHTIPRLAGDFKEGIEKQRADFKEALQEQRESFFREMEREREMHKQNKEMCSKNIERLAESIKDLNSGH